MDISWDDQILSVGTEEGTIELYNFAKISTQTGKVSLPENSSGTSS